MLIQQFVWENWQFWVGIPSSLPCGTDVVKHPTSHEGAIVYDTPHAFSNTATIYDMCELCQACYTAELVNLSTCKLHNSKSHKWISMKFSRWIIVHDREYKINFFEWSRSWIHGYGLIWITKSPSWGLLYPCKW